MSFVWIEESVVWAIHEAQLAEHGGSVGVRDAGLLVSAMGRPINLADYGTPDVAACAAAYGDGLARNRPFIDGNKRTAFACAELFLALNGYALVASDVDCVMIMLAVAAGEMDESTFTEWLRAHVAPQR